MKLSELLVPEFDHEMPLTGEVLRSVTDSHRDWAPHAKSRTMAELASHICSLVAVAGALLAERERDTSTPAGAPRPPAGAGPELLAWFDEHVASTRATLCAASDADLMTTWTLLRHQKKVFEMPRASVFRVYFLNHLIHHRGQLTVYLRECGIPLPSIYGPTADTE
jgi:uncharacterized damage-inducible protein DinB